MIIGFRQNGHGPVGKRAALAIGLVVSAACFPANGQQLPNRMPAGPDAAAASPSEPSLMFTPAEVLAVRRAILGFADLSAQAAQRPAVTAKQATPNIFVSALTDLGDGQWTVWANGERIGPDQQSPGFHVVSVKDDVVEIVVDSDHPVRIQLHPNQTWRADHHDIVEGIVR